MSPTLSSTSRVPVQTTVTARIWWWMVATCAHERHWKCRRTCLVDGCELGNGGWHLRALYGRMRTWHINKDVPAAGRLQKLAVRVPHDCRCPSSCTVQVSRTCQKDVESITSDERCSKSRLPIACNRVRVIERVRKFVGCTGGSEGKGGRLAAAGVVYQPTDEHALRFPSIAPLSSTSGEWQSATHITISIVISTIPPFLRRQPRRAGAPVDLPAVPASRSSSRR